MKYYLYAVRDRKIGKYLTPFASTDDKEVACEKNIYALSHGQVNNPDVCDYEMYYLGYMDNKDGSVVHLDKPEFILDLSQYYVKEGSEDGKSEN